jgi:hypothetical protein
MRATSADGCFLAWAIEESDGEPSSVSVSELKTGNPFGGPKWTVLRWRLDNGRVYALPPL